MQPARIDRVEELYGQHQLDPYPLYREWRAKGPVVVDADGKVIVLSYADCRAALLDPAISVDPRNSRWYQQRLEAGEVPEEEQQRYADPPFIELDPPQHTRHRLLVSQAFAARAAKAGPVVQRVVDERLDQIASRSECDVVREFAYAIPINVLCELFDIHDADERQQIQDWTHFISRSMDPSNPVDPAEVDKVSADFRGHLERLVHARQERQGEDLVTALLSSHNAGQGLTGDEVVNALWLLLVSGHETTSSLIASGLYSLVTDTTLAKRLAAAPEKMPAFVDELLRLTPLVQFLWRHAKQDTTLPCGAAVATGDTVIAVLAAANRDPDHFADPDALDIDRQGSQHLSFGAGAHYCLGATLGRLQTGIALATFARRVVEPELTAAPDRTPLSLGGLTSLPLTFARIT